MEEGDLMAVTVNPDPNLGGDAAQSQPDSYFGPEEISEGSIYQDYMRFPIYYDNAVDNDENNGRVVLSDGLNGIVTMTMNKVPILQLTYPRDGIASKIMQVEGIIMTDCNREVTHQKFRIKQITKSGTQLVINATHIIGDIAGITLSKSIQLPDASASQFWQALQDNASTWIPDLRYDTDISDVHNINVDMSSGTFSNFVFDADVEGDTATQSLLGSWGGEMIADNYHLIHNHKLGRETNIVIKYGDRIQNVQQDENIESTYTAIYPYAKYVPGQAVATEKNTNWSDWGTDWTSIGSVTYTAGGSVDIYDSPVVGHAVVGSLKNGMHVKLGKAVSDGSFTPDGKFQINTVNGDTWYPIATEDGGGWIDSTWINFSKKGDYLVNDAVGYVHTAVSDQDAMNSHYPIRGTGTVNWIGQSKQVRIFYSPDPGKGHYPIGRVLKYGQRFSYDQVATDENGHKWYRLKTHEWVYGPHVKIDSSQDITKYPSKGKGYVKKNAQAYYINKKGQMVEKTHKGKLVSVRNKKKPRIQNVWRGKGKNRKKHQRKPYSYTKKHKIIKTKAKRGYANLNYGQVTVGNTIYYKLSNGTYVKSSGIDWTAKRSSKPTLPQNIVKANAQQKGYIEMYSAPSKGYSLNITVPVNTGFAVDHTATGADGKTWYEITYKGTVGWIPAEDTTTTADADLEPTSKEDSGTSPESESSDTTTVDQAEVLVTLGDGDDGLVFPENAGSHEVQRVLNVDLSSYIKHNDQDLSGQQDDGTFVATEDDKNQLRNAAEQYVIEHRVGEPAISTEVTDTESSDIEGDLTSVNLYDIVTVYMMKLDMNIKAEVTSTEYNIFSHNYEKINIGDIPKTWQHLLVEAANKQTNALAKKVRSNTAHSQHLFTEMADAVKQEGSARLAAETKIAKQVGLVDDKTNKLIVSYKNLDSHITTINNQVQNISAEILNGGTQELQFLDASGQQNFLHPTQIRAVNPDGTYLDFNSEGLGFFDSNSNKIRSAITANGQIAAESIIAGTVTALTLDACLIKGNLVTVNNGIAVSIGTDKPTQFGAVSEPANGGSGIWLDSPNYHNMLSSGRMHIDNGSDNASYMAGGFNINGKDWLSIVKDKVHAWVADYITVKGTRHTIWKG